jgi:hypothetical protein
MKRAMIKKIISITAFIFVTVFPSCSMWSTMDMNSLFEIPVTDITFVGGIPNSSQWEKVPSFIVNDASSNPVTEYSINSVKIATNSAKTFIYIFIEVNAVAAAANFIINISNDYNCDGYSFPLILSGGAIMSHYNICNTTGLGSFGSNSQIMGYKNMEVVFPATSGKFNDIFLISIYTSTSGTPPFSKASVKNSYTPARWVKLK